MHAIAFLRACRRGGGAARRRFFSPRHVADRRRLSFNDARARSAHGSKRRVQCGFRAIGYGMPVDGVTRRAIADDAVTPHSVRYRNTEYIQ